MSMEADSAAGEHGRWLGALNHITCQLAQPPPSSLALALQCRSYITFTLIIVFFVRAAGVKDDRECEVLDCWPIRLCEPPVGLQPPHWLVSLSGATTGSEMKARQTQLT
jgi:hypothetical protein